MTKQRYLELLGRYFDGPIYNNSIELVPIGFFTATGEIISELETEPDVEICDDGLYYFYRVYDPEVRGSGA